MRPRAAVIFDNLGPYHIARLSAAAAVADLLVIEIASRSVEYQWERTAEVPFRRVTLFDSEQVARASWRTLGRRLREVMAATPLDVVFIPGWSGAHAAVGTWAAARLGLRTVVMSESQEIDAPRSTIKEWLKRHYVGLFDAALVGGQTHVSYMRRLGMPAERIFLGYDAVDNDYFARRADEVRATADAVRARRGLPARYFMASSRFVAKKNLPRLVQAYARYRACCPEADRWDLVLLGDGAARPQLEALVRREGLANCVHMPGFKQYDELPVYYGLAGAFLHLSTTEQWGLVVNEAMASGLPVVVSSRCGCARDLVQAGVNGAVVDPYDVESIAQAMRELSRPDIDRDAMGRAGRRIVAAWSPERFGMGFEGALLQALRDDGRPIGWIDATMRRLISVGRP